MSKLLILIPAFNEARAVARVIRECRPISGDILVVDDGSTDRTSHISRAVGATVLRHHTNLGVGAALATGFQFASDGRYTTVVTLDADGAHRARTIPRLLKHHRASGADITIGSRFLRSRFAATVPTTKRVSNFFAATIINRLLGSNFTDVTSGMRVLNANAFGIPLTSPGYGAVYEMIYRAIQSGLHIQESGIGVRYDAETLLCTPAPELMDFLSFALRTGGGTRDLRNGLAWLRSRIAEYRVARIVLGDRFIVLLPLVLQQAYAFQVQCKWFVPSSRYGWKKIL